MQSFDDEFAHNVMKNHKFIRTEVKYRSYATLHEK